MDLWLDCYKQNQKPKYSTTILCCCVSVGSNCFLAFFFFLRKINKKTPASKNAFKNYFFSYLSDSPSSLLLENELNILASFVKP